MTLNLSFKTGCNSRFLFTTTSILGKLNKMSTFSGDDNILKVSDFILNEDQLKFFISTLHINSNKSIDEVLEASCEAVYLILCENKKYEMFLHSIAKKDLHQKIGVIIDYHTNVINLLIDSLYCYLDCENAEDLALFESNLLDALIIHCLHLIVETDKKTK